MKLLIIILPLISSIVSGLLGYYTNYKFSKYLSTTLITISCIITYILYYDIIFNNNIYYINLYNWINIDYIDINMSFILDSISITMLVPILTISSLVHIYSCNYMENDPCQPRYFSILSLFTTFMIILVTADNYLVMFIGWEIIGISSYLLISFWYTRIQASKSGLSAILYNKLGDTFLTIGLLLILNTFGTFNYHIIFSLTNYINTDILNIIVICFIVSIMTKSAQLGLHNWLLNSMEGPTPVSALLHAACLVCAGIYLLIRSSFILEYTPTLLLIILWIGGLTTLIAGFIAITTNDIKKIIALSTMSQLGLMVIVIGLSAYNISLFHLLCHAMFKALLFMSAGSIIHSLLNQTQDIRYMGGFISYLPYTYICILIASLSLMAFPFLSGFYTKDIIIESTYGIYTINGIIIYLMSILSAILTTIYSFRLIYLIFINIPNSNKIIYYNLHESNLFITLPMFILTILSIFLGYLSKDYYIGLGSNLYNNILILPNNLNIIDTEYSINIFIKLLPIILSIIIIIILLLLYEYYYVLILIYDNTYILNIYRLLNHKFMLDILYNNLIIRSILELSLRLNNYIEKGIISLIYVKNLKTILNYISYKIISLSTYYNKFDKNNIIKYLNLNKNVYYYNIYFIVGILNILIHYISYNIIALESLRELFYDPISILNIFFIMII